MVQVAKKYAETQKALATRDRDQRSKWKSVRIAMKEQRFRGQGSVEGQGKGSAEGQCQGSVRG